PALLPPPRSGRLRPGDPAPPLPGPEAGRPDHPDVRAGPGRAAPHRATTRGAMPAAAAEGPGPGQCGQAEVRPRPPPPDRPRSRRLADYGRERLPAPLARRPPHTIAQTVPARGW